MNSKLVKENGQTNYSPAGQSGFIQPKLSIGAVNDSFEREADSMADNVMKMRAVGIIQRKCAHCEEEEKAQLKPMDSFIQKKGTDGTNIATDSVRTRIHSSKGNGQGLNKETRNFMESRFGTSFSAVNVHTGQEAVQLNRELNARAFTVGNDIYFNEGQYQENSETGKHLLAHELTHTIQQAEGNADGVQRQAALPPAAAPADGGLSDAMLKQVAVRLRNAMAGWGTDEEAIYSSFAGHSQPQVDAIARVYQSTYNRSLIADLQEELNEDEMKHLAIFSPTGVKTEAGFSEMLAIQLRDAMRGLGTDEDSIMAALTGRTQPELALIKTAYQTLTHHSLETDLRDELSGVDLTMALLLLQQGVLNLEDQIYFAVTGLGTDEETLFAALHALKGDTTKIMDAISKYKQKGYGDLLDDTRDDLSGSEMDDAMESLHGTTKSNSCSGQQRKTALGAISKAVSLAQNAAGKLQTDVSNGKLSSDVTKALENNFNPGKSAGAVTLAVATRVGTVLSNAANDLMTVADVDCGVVAPCDAGASCGGVVLAWTRAFAGYRVQLCPAFFSCDDNKPVSMLHEFIHHMGVRDQFYRHQGGFDTLIPIGNGSGLDSLNNADSYAHLAENLW